MRFKLFMACENAAFDGDNLRPEIARILREVAEKVESGCPDYFYQTVRDVNGNDIGRFRLADKPDNA